MRTAKIGLDLRLTTGGYGTTHKFVTVDLPTFYELFWAACAKAFKKRDKTEDSSPGLAAKSEKTLGKTTSIFSKASRSSCWEKFTASFIASLAHLLI